jgi:hypothetical protein
MLRRTIGIAATLVTLAAAVAVVPQRGGADSTKDVLVANGPTQPVPVKLAEVTNVAINGTPAVNVANTPTVNLAPGTVVGVRSESEREPATFFSVVPLGDGEFRADQPVFTVPAGKRFVLEDFSGGMDLPTGQKALTISLSAGDGEVVAPATFAGTHDTPNVDFDIFNFGRPARLYANAGVTVYAHASRDARKGFANAFVNAIGYLVDAP